MLEDMFEDDVTLSPKAGVNNGRKIVVEGGKHCMVHSMQDKNRLVASSEALLDRQRKRPFSGTFSSKRLRELNRTK